MNYPTTFQLTFMTSIFMSFPGKFRNCKMLTEPTSMVLVLNVTFHSQDECKSFVAILTGEALRAFLASFCMYFEMLIVLSFKVTIWTFVFSSMGFVPVNTKHES